MSGQDPIDRRSSRPPRRALAALALAALGIGAPQAATDRPDSGWAWAFLIGGSLLGAAAATEVLDLVLRWIGAMLRPPAPLPPGPEPDAGADPRRPKRRISLRAVLLPTLATAVALAIGLTAPTVKRIIWFQIYGCAPPTAIRVLTTAESLAPMAEVATAYARSTAEHNRGCPEADVYVYAADQAASRDALLSGWSGESLRELGPRPDVWLPDSTVETGRLTATAKATGSPLPISAVGSIATTPLVLGLPVQAVKAGQANGAGQNDERWNRQNWFSLLRAAENIGLAVVRPDPTRSATGEIATDVIYSSLAGGRAPSSTADATAERALEHRIGLALDQGAYPLGDALDVLCRRRALGGSTAANGAVLLTEQQLVRYNQGLPLGEGCPATAQVPENERLVAAYPLDTVGLDHPFAQLHWPDQAPGQAAGAKAFGDWLRSDAGASALLATGLRPTAGRAGSRPVAEPLVEQWGARTDAVFYRSSPPAAQVASVLDQYTAATRRGRTLLLVDSSGSMSRLVGAGRKSRLVVAREAARTAVRQVTSRDEFGLWTFPAGSQPTRQLVGVAARSSQADATAVDQRLASIRPAGGTPLYQAVAAATDALQPPDPDRVTLLLVLTDGQDTAGGPTPARLASVARTAGVRISVVAFGEANCAGQALQALTVDSGGQCVDAEAGSLDVALVALIDSAGGRTHGN